MLFVDNKKVKAPVLSPTTIQYQSITAVDELLQTYLDGQSASIIFYLQINMHKHTPREIPPDPSGGSCVSSYTWAPHTMLYI